MELLIVVLVTVVLSAAVYTDLRSSRIPNWLTFTAMGLGLVAHAGMAGWEGLFFCFAGLTVGLGLFLLPYMSGSIGAGDVKLLCAVGAMLGPYGALAAGVLAIVLGGVYALAAMTYHWGGLSAGRRLFCATHGAFTGEKAWSEELRLPFHLRYALPIAAGTLLFQLGLHPFGG